jgi:hypothetical protein
MASHIKKDSARYVARVDKMAKHGSAAKGTHAAHKLSWEVFNGIGTHTGGRPLADASRTQAAMGAASNLRIKSAHSNLVLDRRRDERVVAAVRGDRAVRERTTAERAYQAYKAGSAGDKAMKSRAALIGDLVLRTGKPGRPTLVRNLHKKR